MSTQLIVIQPDELLKLIQDALRQMQPSPQEHKETEEKLLTSDELSERLHLSKVTIWKLRRSGKIKSYKLGRRVYFKLSEVLDNMK